MRTEHFLDNDFQSNSTSKEINTGPHATLNGLGILYYGGPDIIKHEDNEEEEILSSSSPDNVNYLSNEVLCPLRATNHDRPSSYPTFSEDPFDEIFRQLASTEKSLIPITNSSPILQYPDNLALPSMRSFNDEHPILAASAPTNVSLKGRSPASFSMSPGDKIENMPAMVGPFPDINMFSLAYMQRPPEVGVNPTDVMGQISPASSQSDLLNFRIRKRSSSPCLSVPYSDSSSATEEQPSVEAMEDIIAILSNNAEKENLLPQTQATTVSHMARKQPPMSRTMSAPNNRFPALTYRDAHIPNEDPFDYHLATPTPAAHRSPLVDLRARFNMETPFKMEAQSIHACDSPEKPVLNAHLGIHLSELVDRAERHRLRFPGVEIDKNWLLAFAGKLSKHGERLNDYRCYVTGCTQMNRRRDHILVHVGSHVDQRPFSCSVWSVLSENYSNQH